MLDQEWVVTPISQFASPRRHLIKNPFIALQVASMRQDSNSLRCNAPKGVPLTIDLMIRSELVLLDVQDFGGCEAWLRLR